MGTLARTASAAGAAIILSAIGFAAPAQATYACWDSASGQKCRDFGEGAAGRTMVRVLERPTFTGILKVGQTVTSYPGEWVRAQTLKYEWLRDGVSIPGARDETYEITAADDGRALALRVTGSAAGLTDAVATTLPSPIVSATNTVVYTASPAIIITGEAPDVSGWSRVGFTLELNELGAWSPDAVALQWQADGLDIEGATTDTYKIRTADLGKVVTLKVTGGQPGQGSVSKSNTAPAVTPGYIHPTDEMWLAGGSKVGDTLNVEGSGGWYADGEPITLSYQWERDGQKITGASRATYTVVAADQGHQIRAQVTATAPGHSPNTQSTLYNDIVEGDTVDDGGQPAPAPAPAPVKPAPAPAPIEQAPAPVKQAPAPAPAQAPTPAPQAPIRQAELVQPTTRNVSSSNLVPARAGGGFVQPQAASRAESPVADAAGAAAVAAPADAAPADTAPAATASPAPSSTSGPAATTAQAASTSPANPLPLALWIAGVLIAAGLVWVIRPLRASVSRIVARKAP
ncbi:hypothetical protein ACFRJ8_20165 [Arthrobacter sp. NPDC056886]|uniref:hypothetical protein n=1 Tax=Arthrobacter sp. NPDC056886 TaxID=3345960 RepID=UPI00366CDC3B